MKLKLLATAALAFGVVSANAETVLKVQTSTQSGAYEYTYIAEEWGNRLKAMSGGELSIEFFPINAVVDRKETPEAVMAGVLSGDLTAVSYFTGRDPAFAILGDLIAGYDSVDQVQSFCRHGGGRDALQALWDEKMPGAVHVVGCGAVAKEALVAKVKIEGVAGLEGVKIRSPSGLAATVFQKAGAAPVSMSLSDVFTALEKGVIDAGGRVRLHQQFDQRLPSGSEVPALSGHPFHGGSAVHDQQGHLGQPDRQIRKTILETWFYAAYVTVRRQLDLQDKAQVANDTAEGEITVVDWSQEERDKFRAIAVEAWEETAGKSPAARAALDAHYAYMKSIGLIK
jgi:TRAP-type mannitol/chloroaromatic compound transport system substrate-binding protein